MRWIWHCVKSAQIRSYFWSVFSCIRIEYGERLNGNKKSWYQSKYSIWIKIKLIKYRKYMSESSTVGLCASLRIGKFPALIPPMHSVGLWDPTILWDYQWPSDQIIKACWLKSNDWSYLLVSVPQNGLKATIYCILRQQMERTTWARLSWYLRLFNTSKVKSAGIILVFFGNISMSMLLPPSTLW